MRICGRKDGERLGGKTEKQCKERREERGGGAYGRECGRGSDGEGNEGLLGRGRKWDWKDREEVGWETTRRCEKGRGSGEKRGRGRSGEREQGGG